MVSIEKDGKIIIEEVEPEEKPKVNQLSEVELGSYVQYNPKKATLTIDSSHNGYGNQDYDTTKYIQLWRVLSKEDKNVEIISDKVVGNLTLSGKVVYCYYDPNTYRENFVNLNWI